MIDYDEKVTLWRTRQILTRLSKLKGLDATSVITLILPPGEQISKINAKLTNEYSTASNIKSRVNRLAVLSAITSAQNKLKLYKTIPKNGLIILSGTILDEQDKERKISLAFEPPRPLVKFVYLCDNTFHLESVLETLQDETLSLGFIIISGDSLMLATIRGNEKIIHCRENIELRKKHGRGGQSQRRFERQAEEGRHHYLNKIKEFATRYFLSNDVPNISALYIAGTAGLKDRFLNEGFLDPRLHPVLQEPTISISYGLDRGLDEAITLLGESLHNLKYVEEQKILTRFFNFIAQDVPKISYGFSDTLSALNMGLVEILIVSEHFSAPIPEIPPVDLSNDIDPTIIDYLHQLCRSKHTTMVIVSSATSQGSQFLKGFGGIGSILRYEYHFDISDNIDDTNDFDNFI